MRYIFVFALLVFTSLPVYADDKSLKLDIHNFVLKSARLASKKTELSNIREKSTTKTYKSTLNISRAVACISDICADAVKSERVVYNIKIGQKLSNGTYDYSVENLTQGIRGAGGTASISNGRISFYLPVAWEGYSYNYDLDFFCIGNFRSNNRKIVGVCTAQYQDTVDGYIGDVKLTGTLDAYLK